MSHAGTGLITHFQTAIGGTRWADSLALVEVAEQLASWEGEKFSHGNYRLLRLDNFASFHTHFWPDVAPFTCSVMGWEKRQSSLSQSRLNGSEWCDQVGMY